MPGVQRTLLKELEKIGSGRYGFLSKLAEKGYGDGKKLDEMVNRFVVDRFNLATGLLEFCEELSLQSEFNCRAVISRCYYSMYHCARACILHKEKADVQEHKAICKKIDEVSKEFGEILRAALVFRREVDYSPYPEIFWQDRQLDLKEAAKKSLKDARRFIKFAKDFLKRRELDVEKKV